MDLFSPFKLLLVSFILGWFAQYLGILPFFWLINGFLINAILLINGLLIAIEDKDPQGLDYIPNETLISKKEFETSVKIHVGLISIVIFLFFLSWHYFN